MEGNQLVRELLQQLQQCDEWIREAVAQGCTLSASATLQGNQRVITKAHEERTWEPKA